MRLMKCKQCGAPIEANDFGSYTCEYCGSVFVDEKEKTAVTQGQPTIIREIIRETKEVFNGDGVKGKKSKGVALLLCLFLGWIGAHRFYEGKFFTGIIWAITGGLSGVGVFIDFLILLVKPRSYFKKL